MFSVKKINTAIKHQLLPFTQDQKDIHGRTRVENLKKQ